MTGSASQFGIDEEIIRREFHQYAVHPLVEIIGFHIFNATNVQDMDSLVEHFEKSIAITVLLAKELGIQPGLLDLGGGFSAPFASNGQLTDYTALKSKLEISLNKHFDHLCEQDVRIAFESGRYLVATCGKLISTVQYVKESKNKRFIILDSGINHLSGVSATGRIPRTHIEYSGQESTGLPLPSIITGPLCTPIDTLSRNSNMPILGKGDQLVVPNVGAYGLTASLFGFLSRRMPVEIIHQGDLILDVTRQKVVREIYQGEGDM
jgi:diaminopimelate decarboxylase